MAIGTYISIITLNVNGLNATTKRHRLAEWIQKQDRHTCFLQETHFRPQDVYKLKMRGQKTIFHANGKQKKAGVVILISDKIDLKIKKISRNKEEQLHNDQRINPRGRHNNCKYLYTQQRSTTIQKTNTNRHKRETDSNTIIVGDFNTPLTPMDRSSKQKINKETQVLNDTLDEMDPIDIFMTFHPNAEEYNFFSRAHGTCSRIDYILGHKSSLIKFNILKLYQTSFLTTML